MMRSTYVLLLRLECLRTTSRCSFVEIIVVSIFVLAITEH